MFKSAYVEDEAYTNMTTLAAIKGIYRHWVKSVVEHGAAIKEFGLAERNEDSLEITTVMGRVFTHLTFVKLAGRKVGRILFYAEPLPDAPHPTAIFAARLTSDGVFRFGDEGDVGMASQYPSEVYRLCHEVLAVQLAESTRRAGL